MLVYMIYIFLLNPIEKNYRFSKITKGFNNALWPFTAKPRTRHQLYL